MVLMRQLRLALLVLAGALAACTTTGALPRAARAQQNTAVVLAFLDTVFNKHEVEQAFKRYVGTSYRQHNPAVADGTAAAVRALTQLTRELDPQLRLEVKRTIAQGDLVAVHSRYVPNPSAGAGGTAGTAPAGGRGQAVVDIFRLEHGKIVEHWDVSQDIPDRAANDNSMF
jgi:predicted SnoaL-like aldol condensation-catalyzing enzyme